MLATRRTLAMVVPCHRCHHFVGPSHPISNFRPVIYNNYDSVITKSSSHSRDPGHPYSLEEFSPENHPCSDQAHCDLEHTHFDEFNHRFWSSSNRRYYNAEQAALGSTSSTEEKEQALGRFRQQWLKQEGTLQTLYGMEYRRRMSSVTLLEARSRCHNLYRAIMGRR